MPSTETEMKFLHTIAEGMVNASPIEGVVIHIKPIGRPAYTGFYGKVTPENLVVIMTALKQAEELRARGRSEDNTPTTGVNVDTTVLNPSVHCSAPGCVLPPHADGMHYDATGAEFVT